MAHQSTFFQHSACQRQTLERII